MRSTGPRRGLIAPPGGYLTERLLIGRDENAAHTTYPLGG